jgi:hypothetical protein
MISSLACLQPKDISALIPDLTVFLFPIGGIEQHGPHLPVGTKLFQAEARAKHLAQILERRLPNWSFILMPLLPLSVDSNTNSISLNVRPHVVRDAIVDQCTELARLKFKNFVAISSQLTPKQLCALEDAAKIVNRKKIFGGVGAGLISVSGALIEPRQVFDSPMISLPTEHGGAIDTGFILRENEKLLDPTYISLESHPKPKASVSRFFAFIKNELDGYWGMPKAADVEASLKQESLELNEIAEKMIPWLEKGKGQNLFKSGYGYFPFNGSFFKAYFLATLFFVIMAIWALWNMRDLFNV